MKILLTGAAGMIGSEVIRTLLARGHDVIGVDKKDVAGAPYTHVVSALATDSEITALIAAHVPDRVIHLAALAHTAGESDLTLAHYREVNVELSRRIFRAVNNIPVLFISTADVYGFAKKRVTPSTAPSPVTPYAKTKLEAERACTDICPRYTIFRLQPVYTDTVKRDIRKRYYLKYPSLGYLVGRGTSFEALDVRLAAARMADWCEQDAKNGIAVLKDPAPLSARELLRAEKAEGRARHVLHIPRFLAVALLAVATCLTGRNNYTYLLHKAVYPLQTE